MPRRAPLKTLAVLLLSAAALSTASAPVRPPDPAPGKSRSTLPAAFPVGARPAPGASVPGELLIRFRPHAGPQGRAALRAAWRATRRRAFAGGAEHWRLADVHGAADAMRALRRHPDVEYVEPNYIVSMSAAPDDEHYRLMWALDNTGQTGGLAGADVDAERAWDITTGSRAVRVAVIDTGVDYTHPDLAANIWINEGEIPGNGRDDDGNGFVDDVHGYDMVNDDGDPMDDNGHGTHVAGTIGAVGNNVEGVAGVCWQVSLVPVKFLGSQGFGNLSDAVAALEYATALGVHVMNNSWGGGGFSVTLRDAIARAHEAGILFVAAAGNSGENADQLHHYPASYDVPNVISVAATDDSDQLASFSNYGALSVDLGAPGVSVLSTVPDAYTWLSGTSMAAPHVSGAAALLLSLAPGANVAVLKQRLLETAEPIPPLQGKTVTGGRLNLFLLVAERDTVPPGAVGDLRIDQPFSNSVRLAWTASGDDDQLGRAFAYDLRASTTPLDEASLGAAPRQAGVPDPGEPGQPQAFEVAGLSPGTTWHFALRAMDEWGNAGPASFVSADTLAPPVLSLTPASLRAEVPYGGTASAAVHVENAGPGSLDWRLDLPPPPAGSPPSLLEPLSLDKGEPDPRTGERIDTRGGPDRFGYEFADSTEPGGPEFVWRDISSSGAVVALTGDDQVSDPLPIGFAFPFYGRLHHELRVATNGWLSFGPADTWPVNQPLPSAHAPALMVAPLWDDLDFQGAPRVRHASRPGELILQYTDVSRFGEAARLTFQVILKSTGEILFLYHTLDGDLTSATVGVQDAGVDGLQVAFNRAYLLEGLAVRVRAAPSWWTASPSSGRLMAGEEQPVEVRFDAAGVPEGVHESSLLVRSNDPLAPQALLGLTLVVQGDPGLLAAPQAVDFGEVAAGQAARRSLSLTNTGTGRLELAVLESVADVAVFPAALGIPAGETRGVTLIWSPPAHGPLAATLRLGGGGIAAGVPLSGAALPEGAVRAEPAFLAESLAGGAVIRTVRLTNTTGEALPVTLEAVTGSAPEVFPLPAAVSWDAGEPPAPVSTIALPRAAYPPRPGASASGEPAGAAPASGILPNGGFETGGFSEWSATASAFGVWLVSRKGEGFFGTADPFEGTFDALNMFDGEAGQTFTLARDIDVPADAARTVLSWHDRIQFDSYGFRSSLPRVYEATVQDPEGRRLALVARVEILLDGRPHQDLGWVRRRVDLTPWAGRRVRLVLHESIPETWTGPAQIEFDDFRLDVVPIPSWLRVAPGEAIVPAGGAIDLQVTLDAAEAPPGTWRGLIRARHGDGLTADLPATLISRPVPRIALAGGWVHLESSLPWLAGQSVTQHTLTLPVPAAGSGRFTLRATGDFGDEQGESAELQVEGRPIGSVGGIGLDCAPAEGEFRVDDALLADIAADGVVQATVRNAGGVDPFCPESGHLVALSYRAVPDALAFGGVYVGASSQQSLDVINAGDAPLHVSVAADGAAFAADPHTLVVPPEGSAVIKVRFTPQQTHEAASTLVLLTDDPSRPRVTVALRGEGLEPPVMSVEPASLAVSMLPGEARADPVTVANRGGSPLSFSAAVRTVSRPRALGASSCAPRRLVISEKGRSGLSVLDLATFEVRHVGLGLASPGKIALSRDGGTAWVLDEGPGDLTGMDLITGQRRVVIPGLIQPSALAIAPDGATAYVTARDGTLQRVDLASGGATVVTAALSAPSALTLGAGGAAAWVLDEGGLLRVDLSTGAVTSAIEGLAGDDLVVDSSETTVYVAAGGDVLAAALSDGGSRRVATGLGGAAGIALAGEHLYVGESTTGRIARIDRFTGKVVLLATGLAVPRGLALDGSCDAFASVEPAGGIVPAGGTLTLQLRLDASGLAAGAHEGMLEIAGNDPVTPMLAIPLELEVQAAPDIELAGEPAEESSTRAYDSVLATTVHELPIPALPRQGGILELEAEGDFGDLSETALLSAGGRVLGSAGGSGADCAPARFQRAVTAGDLAAWRQDQALRFEVSNSGDTGLFCGFNRHTVRLTWQAPADRLDFGTAYIGQTRRRSLRVINRGSEALSVTASAGPGFGLPEASFVLPPRAARLLAVDFTAAVPGEARGTLSLATNDPDEPFFGIPLTGLVADPPRLRVDPASLDLRVETGDRLTLPITVSNAGASPLSFTLEAPGGGPPPGAIEAGPGVSEVSVPRDPAVVEMLSPSPVPLGFVVEDPASGVLYAQQRDGAALYRYDAARDVWEPLAPSPVQGRLGGAALLDGRLYTTWHENPSLLGVYSIAADSWSTLPHPLPPATGIAGDGLRYLYLVSGLRFSRLDVATRQVEALAPAPYTFFSATTLRYLDGRIFAHQGTGGRGFASYDVRTGFWSRLPPVPDDPQQAAALDPVDRAYHVLGSRGDVFRFDIAAGAWSMAAARPFVPGFGGMGWLSHPVPGIHISQGSTGLGYGRLATRPVIDHPPVSGVIPPGGAVTLDVALDASRAPAGLRTGALALQTDDPAHPRLLVPWAVDVRGAPRMRLTGPTVRQTSLLHFSGVGASTMHMLPVHAPPAGDGTVELLAQGAFSGPGRAARVFLDGTLLGEAGGPGIESCVAGNQVDVPLAALEAAVSAGTARLTVTNSGEVDPADCSIRRHMVSLSWPVRVDRLDFGDTRLEQAGERSLEVSNTGTAPLAIDLETTDPSFRVPLAHRELPPGTSSPILVSFLPAARGAVTATLRIRSNDPRAPVTELPLTGNGYVLQRAAVEPGSLTVALPPGGEATRTLRLSNLGDRPLQWGLQAIQAGDPRAQGYAARTSEEPGGPPFSWIDISRTGTGVTLFLDDQSSAPIPLGFEFPFFDSVFTSARVSTNGFLSFTSDLPAPGGGVSLPATGPGIPMNLVAPFWSDLDFQETRLARYEAGPDRFVLQYTNVALKEVPGSELTFQVVLRPSGAITFQYLRLSHPPPRVTIGIQNHDGSAGLTVSTAPGWPRDGLAVEIAKLRWMVPEIRQGELPGGGMVDIPVRFDAAGTQAGESEALLLFGTNDPDRPRVDVPARLHVGEAAASWAAFEPATLNPASRGRTVRLSLQLPAGLDPRLVRLDTLSINGVLPALAGTAAFSDADGDGLEELSVKFDRRALEGLLVPGDNLLAVTGEVRDITWFRGAAPMRLMKGPAASP